MNRDQLPTITPINDQRDLSFFFESHTRSALSTVVTLH
jgi:hypothetical protein